MTQLEPRDDEPTSWITEVRARLASPPPTRLAPPTEVEIREAAVLVPLYVDARELWTVLTRRSIDLPHHKGQIAFPGGGRELGETMWQAATREAHEEIALPAEAVVELGQLDEVATPAGFRVFPQVGAIPREFEPVANEGEIDEVFSLPLSALSNPNLVEDRPVVINGQERQLRIYHVGRHQIWGLTARVLQNLLDRLGLGGDEVEANPAV
jgi:8-oxo-dGTP pyrophosphatase MutT (NUDIX family)